MGFQSRNTCKSSSSEDQFSSGDRRTKPKPKRSRARNALDSSNMNPKAACFELTTRPGSDRTMQECIYLLVNPASSEAIGPTPLNSLNTIDEIDFSKEFSKLRKHGCDSFILLELPKAQESPKNSPKLSIPSSSEPDSEEKELNDFYIHIRQARSAMAGADNAEATAQVFKTLGSQLQESPNAEPSDADVLPEIADFYAELRQFTSNTSTASGKLELEG